MASQAKTNESKKDEFRDYLERTGVIDQLTKILVYLYEENDRPSNPLEFIKRNLSDPEEIEQDNLKSENKSYKEENEKLKKQLAELTKQLKSSKGDEGN